MKNFKGFGLPEKLLGSLDEMGFFVPTPIQAKTIPVALGEKRDVLGTAQTGTGKTGAFAIPLCAKLLGHRDEVVLVLTPTRELARQVITVFRKLLLLSPDVKGALLIGGESIEKQIRALKKNPRVLVGTPGRINDHLVRGTLRLERPITLVLDEMDLMLDMGFDVQVASIVERIPDLRQRLMFSATSSKRIARLAGEYLRDPVRISVGGESMAHENIAQEVLEVDEGGKYGELVRELDKREGSIIVFVRTRNRTEKIGMKLCRDGYMSAAIHGNLRQSRRERMLQGFRSKKYRILVATDVASRGIDVPHVRHVINYDLPQCGEDYIHRIGRTARGDELGAALSFVTRREQRAWELIQRLLNSDEEKESVPKRKNFKRRKFRKK